MSILCSMFGHKQNKGWYGDGLYGEIVPASTDGIGRIHAFITADCDRCGKSYTLARLHLNSPTILAALAALNGGRENG